MTTAFWFMFGAVVLSWLFFAAAVMSGKWSDRMISAVATIVAGLHGVCVALAFVLAVWFR